MKVYGRFWTNCSKCGREISRDVRWEGRVHECDLCRQKRRNEWQNKRNEVFRKFSERAKLKHPKKFEEGRRNGKNMYDILDELFEAGKLL